MMCMLNMWGMIREWSMRVEADIVESRKKEPSHLKKYLSTVRVQFAFLLRFEKSVSRRGVTTVKNKAVREEWA